jgi:hypothetical protein
MSQIINLRADDYVQLSSFTCYLLEAGVQIIEFPKLVKFPGDTCISAYIHANHGLVAVMDLGGVTIHSFEQFTPNMRNVFEIEVTPERNSQPQVFAFMGNKLAFIPISTTDSMLARRTTFTDLAMNKLYEIVARENMIVRQLQQLKEFAGTDPNIRKTRSIASWIFSPDIGLSLFQKILKLHW